MVIKYFFKKQTKVNNIKQHLEEHVYVGVEAKN